MGSFSLRLFLAMLVPIPGAFLFGLLLDSVGRCLESCSYCSYMSTIFALGVIALIYKFLNSFSIDTKQKWNYQ